MRARRATRNEPLDTIVGRDAELDALGHFLDALPASRGGLVLEGEAGIGKTVLWLEAVRMAEARGYRVLVARPAESEGQLPYAALSDLVGGVFDETRALLPAPQERGLAVALLQAEPDVAADERTIGTALVSIFASLQEEEPVLVAVDDVQWLDAASERALAFALRRSPTGLRVLLTRRAGSGERLPLWLEEAFPEEQLERLVPGPLKLAALHHLIAQRLGAAPGRPALTRISAASGGNPFFALELAQALAREGGDRALSDPLPVPQSLQELVAVRMGHLSALAQEAVLVCAALSRPTAAAVERALPSSADVAAALAEAEEAEVLVSTRGRIRFTHPLLASVVYASVRDERRRRLHRRLADVASDLEERARHRALCALDPDEPTAAELELAAKRAAHRGAQNAAAELFEAARRLTPTGRPDELARRLLGESAALNALGQFGDAGEVARRALASARTTAVRVEAFTRLAGLAWYGGDARTAGRNVERALAEAAGELGLLGPIYSKGVRFSFSADFPRAFEYAGAASDLLSETREPALLGHVLVDRVVAGAFCGFGAQHELLDRALELETTALPDLPDGPQPMVLIWFHCIDDFAAASARYVMEEQWYRERGLEFLQADRRSHVALAELRAGAVEEAERHVEEACAAVEQLELDGPRAMIFEKRALVDAHRGRTDRARARLVPMIEQYERAGQAWWAALSLSTLAFAEFAAGDHAAADDALVRMGAHAQSVGAKDILLDRSEPFHVEVLLRLGDLERARGALMRLEERDRTLPRPWTRAALPRTRALLLAATGQVPEALAALDELDLASARRLPFEFGWTLLVRGRLLRRAKQKRAAAETLRDALDIFERLGASSWADWTRNELARVGLRHRSPDELTASERAVAELAARGLTNRQVAEAVFMSPKTVEANLSRVYRKLGIRSRAELGARIATEARDAELHT
jgi:DNA-binding CsgD family transcriptional regulator